MDQSRRAFLGLALKSSPQARDDGGNRHPAGSVSVPVIAAERCSGCGACVGVCPRDAITLVRGDETEETAAYVSHAGACGECDACLTICDRDAIRIEPSARDASLRVILFEQTCPRCSAPFHWPAVRGTRRTLCRICAARTPRGGRIVR